MAIQRSVACADESQQRRLLVDELVSAVADRYPADDFTIEHLWRGPGKGASLIIRHLPSGLSIGRDIGYDRDTDHLRQLYAELFRTLPA